MPKYHPKNERMKREYLRYLAEAEGKSAATLEAVSKSLLRYEVYTGFKDFSTLHREQIIGFKKHLAGQKAERSGEPLRKATLLTTFNQLKTFFKWLACQPGYKQKIHLPDIAYLSLSDKETRIAKTPKHRPVPTLEQIRRVLDVMPTGDDIALRNRALVAFTILTGARDSAIISLKLRHIDVEQELVLQDPTEVKTKFSKRIDTYFFPVGNDIKQIVVDWISYLREVKLYGEESPLMSQYIMT